MISAATHPLTPAAFALTLGFLLLAPLAIVGVALINTGLSRSRSAAQSLLGAMLVISVAVIAFALIGATFATGSGHIFQLSGKLWNWAGTGPVCLVGLASEPPRDQLTLLFEFLAVAFVVLIPWGSGAERCHLRAGIVSAAVLAAIIFPFAAHWILGGGWLAQLGVNFSLGAGFLDAGGAATIHVLGGVSALAVVWIAGSRRGKFPKEGLATAMPGHNVVYVLFGCLIALVGWLAWNMAGALLWIGSDPSALPVTAINTLLSAAAALSSTFLITRVRFGKPDASLCANGWLSGLVASSGCAAVATPIEALFVGCVSGFATPLLVEVLELALSIDDPSGGIVVHAVSGVWGLFATGLFAPLPGQLLAQLVGIATIVGLVFPALYLLFALINRAIPFRVDVDGERIGMDLHELGGGAYPEFVVHRDDPFR